MYLVDELHLPSQANNNNKYYKEKCGEVRQF